MAATSTFVLLLYLLTLNRVHAFYGDFFNKTFDIPPLKMGVSVAVEDTIYILGGVKADYSNARNWDITTLKFDSQQNAITSTITNTEPQLNRDISHAYHLGDNKTIVLANVQYPNFNITDAQSNTTVELRTSGISFYDIPSNTWTNPQISLAVQPLPPLRQAVMSAISPENDAIYVMGGFYVTLFDTRRNQIYTQNVSGISPTPRFAAGSALGGGQLSTVFSASSNALPGLVALDTTTWAWFQPKIPGSPAAPSIYSSLTLFQNTKLVVALGVTESIPTQDIGVIADVLQSGNEIQHSKMRWFTNNKDLDQVNSGANANRQQISEGAIAVNSTPQIWRATVGRNAFVVYSIYRSIDSPVVVQEVREAVNIVRAPDVRFCINGFNSSVAPLQIYCSFSNGTDCSSQVLPLDWAKHTPRYPDLLGTPICFMFLSTPAYSFTDDKSMYRQVIGTPKMTFNIRGPPNLDENGDITTTGAIYVNMYASDYNPNIKAYQLALTSKVKPDEYRKWILNERDANLVDTIIIEAGVRSTALYDINQRKVLWPNDGWNYVGFSSHYDETFTSLHLTPSILLAIKKCSHC
ncbi:hypothetical protein MAM1_0037c02716 [Mucor ambiguus]|uniref:Uncharacterized protein n=1 Tax=Mucor ambiguus TaxID=91626 RepID=A0A0C9M889_9FUNG|nr:hypothetical protein MAM1_0037c02716 [Mucor ambiguus]